MSEASKTAQVRIVLADYAVGDQTGKMTLVGAGVNIFGINPESKKTAPFYVWASVSFTPDAAGSSPLVELWLEAEDDGHVVEVPELTEDQAASRPLRVATVAPLRRTVIEGVDIPFARPKSQFVMQFQTGLKLEADRAYRWRVAVDGETRDDWTEAIYVVEAKAVQASD